jgi:hypothetical protein
MRKNRHYVPSQGHDSKDLIMNKPRSRHANLSVRRGMLLLMVLLMLSLFMAIGALLLTVGLRARSAVRAYGDAAISTSANDNLSREALDDALMLALRGGGHWSALQTTTGTAWESILEDKYGSPIFATGSIQPGVIPPAFMSLSLNVLSASGTSPSRLNGRVLTIKPRGNDGEMASYRILGASGTSPTMTVHVAAMPGNTPRRQPTGSFDVVINGREFTPVSGTSVPENYDAYDDENIWLAQPVITGTNEPLASGTLGPIQVRYFNRGSFIGEFSDDATNGPYKDLEEILTDPDYEPFRKDVVDNDNDGVPDGIWMPPSSEIWGAARSLDNAIALGAPSPNPTVIPDRPSPLGGTIRTQVSYLILDLDGRVNINAAGASGSLGVNPPPTNVPFGMGYGPADLDPSLLFPATLPTGSNGFLVTSTGTWQPLLQSGMPGISGTLQPTINQRRMPPEIALIEGRYGRNGRPGIDGDETGPFQLTGTATGTSASGTASSYWSLISGSNTLADLQGQRKVYMQLPTGGEITPTLTFFTNPATPVASGSAAARLDAADDPYELRLDADAPRPAEHCRLLPSVTSGSTVNPYTVDNPFTLAELERILRANDPDALQLPQRLAAGAAGHAQQSRMTITTDSWDTPALTGGAARVIEDYMATTGTFPALTYNGTASWRTTGSGSSNPVAPDIAAGLRFNINRPVLSGTTLEALQQQHEYCKGLYTLALMLGETNTARAAQWAVNALDFRDEDDRISWFEYDTNIANGWNVDGLLTTTSDPDRAVVWGAERPDVVITETAASDGSTPGTSAQIFITLRRVSHNVTTTTGTISPTSLQFSSPRWRVRFGSDNRIVWFSSATAPPTPYAYFLAESSPLGLASMSSATVFTGTSSAFGTGPHVFTTGSNALTTGSAASLCICPQLATPPFSVSGIPQFNVVIAAPSTFSLAAAGSATVFLERLADMNSPPGNLNPYVVVDRAPVQTGPASLRRPNSAPRPEAAFWATTPTVTGWTGGGTTLTTHNVGAAQLHWYHWPNRPFISQAELTLVPTGTGAPYQIFTDGTFPTSSLASGSTTQLFGTRTISGSTVPASGTSSLGNLLLEATYVPSRFAGNSITVSGTAVDRFGLDIFPAHQISKWREPGKININTIVSGTSSGVGLDDIVWSILTSGTTSLNSFAGTPRTRTQPAIPGGGGNPATPAVPGARGTPPRPARSISQLLSGSSVTLAHYSIDNTGTTTLSGSANGFRDTNPFFSYSQAIRLANTATIRSQVFAVWISVKITDDSPNAPSPVTKRMFAIVDRSIPVGYAPGQDLNVRDTIRLKRYLD